MERFGAFSGPLQAFTKAVTGDGDRDCLRCEDISFSASSRSTYFAQRVCLAGVIGDANMVAALATRDAHGMLERAAARRMRASYRANLGVGYNFHGGGFDGGYSVS